MMSKSGERETTSLVGMEERWFASTRLHRMRYSSASCSEVSGSVEHLAKGSVSVAGGPVLDEATLNIA
jgi:hypothetical protein